MKRTDMFWAGFVMYPCLSSLHQDALGKDAYVRLVSDAWISGWWTVPIALVALSACAWIYAKGLREDTK